MLAPLLLAATLSANDFVAAFERADIARLNQMLAAQPRRERSRLRRMALGSRGTPAFTIDGNLICLDMRGPGGALLDQYEIELKGGQVASVRSVASTPLARARELTQRGDDLLTDGRFDEAVASFTAAATLTTHGPTQADVQQGLGHVAFLRQDIDTAVRHFEESLALARAANDDWSIASALEALSATDRFRGDLDRAESRVVDALRHFAAAGDRVFYAWILGSYGAIRTARGDYHGAHRLFREGLALAEEIDETTVVVLSTINLANNAFALGHYREAEALFRRALALSEADVFLLGMSFAHANLGKTLAALGQLPEAVQAYHKGLELKERLGRGESIMLELSNLGEMYRRLGNHEQATAQFEKALSLARKAGYKTGIAHGLHNLGKFEEALALDREIGNRAGIARDLQSIGRAELEAGNRNAARRALEESLAIAEEIGARDSMIVTLAMLSQLGGDSIGLAERALRIATELELPEHLWSAHLALGRAYRRAKRPGDARVALERAIAVVEELRRGVPGGEGAQQQAFERLVEPYHELIALLVEQGQRAAAFQYAERAKARVLLDVLQQGRPDHGDVLTEAERIREAELTARIAEANRGGAAKALRAARLDYDAFLTTVYATHPELRREVAPPPAETIPANAIEFVVTRDRTFVFTATRVAAIEITERELAAEVRRFRDLLASRDLLYEQAARALYDRLLRGSVPADHTLCIVPDGPLWELPFHALQPAKGAFLLDSHAIFYAPSISVLKAMASRPPGTRATRLLAFGNPLVPGQRTSVYRDTPLGPLPHTETEIRAIASLYGAGNSRIRLRGQAREELFKEEAGAFDVLHFATHGILDDTNALYSRLVLSPPTADGEDGLLEAREIMRLDLRARLAVLSACETARGRIGTGEGVIGMSWALFVAGVPSTVVSQWKVDSTSTSDLMIDFHRHLRAGRSKAEALRRAALAARARHPHPFYWAPFVVVGDAR